MGLRQDRFDCIECGVEVPADEDGLCCSCGKVTVSVRNGVPDYGAVLAGELDDASSMDALSARVARLEEALRTLLDSGEGIKLGRGTAEVMNYLNRHREARAAARAALSLPVEDAPALEPAPLPCPVCDDGIEGACPRCGRDAEPAPRCERCGGRQSWEDLVDGRAYPCPDCGGRGTARGGAK